MWCYKCCKTVLKEKVINLVLTVQAFRVARAELFSEARPNVTKLAALITDGKANREVEGTFKEANLTKAENVEVFCVGITSDVSNHYHSLDKNIHTRKK